MRISGVGNAFAVYLQYFSGGHHIWKGCVFCEFAYNHKRLVYESNLIEYQHSRVVADKLYVVTHQQFNPQFPHHLSVPPPASQSASQTSDAVA